MGRTVLILAICLFLVDKTGAQQASTNKKVILDFSQLTVYQALDTLGRHYGVNFSYSRSMKGMDQLKSLHTGPLDINKALDTLLWGSPLGYKMMQHSIVIFPAQDLGYHTISGYVRAAHNGEALLGVSVYTAGSLRGTATNNIGYYLLKLGRGRHKLVFSYLGYQDKEMEIDLQENTALDMALETHAVEITEIKVTRDKKTERVMGFLNSYEDVDFQDIKRVPNLFGEADVIRNLSYLPGISNNDLNSGELYIRGGDASQTTYLFDGVPISDVSHFVGFYSIFNPDMVKNITVHKGGAPASLNGAISALVDVNMKEGNKKKWEVKGGIGLVSARVSAEGPLVKDKTSLVLSARRSYLASILRALAGKGQSSLFYFNDLNLKLDHRFNRNNLLYFSAYMGNDKLLDASEIIRRQWAVNTRWVHFFNPSAYATTELMGSYTGLEQILDVKPYYITYSSNYNNYRVNNNINWLVNGAVKLSAGYHLSATVLEPSFGKPINELSILKESEKIENYLLEQAFFVESDLSLGNKWLLNLGLRSKFYMQYGAGRKFVYEHNTIGRSAVVDTIYFESGEGMYRFRHVEPRVNIRYLLSPNSSIKLAYALTSEPIHRISMYNISLSLRRMVPANEYVPPSKASIISSGFYYISGNKKWEGSCDVFYRKVLNMPFARHNPDYLFGEMPEAVIYPGTNRALGMESSLKLELAKASFLMNYTFTDSENHSKGFNNNKTFVPYFDIRHAFTFFGTLKVGQRWDVSLNWICRSGLPYTPPAGMYELSGHRAIHFPQEALNIKRLPSYHRLDLNFDFAPLKNASRRWKNTWSFSIFNVYARKNPLGVVYFREYTAPGGAVLTEQWGPRFVYFYQFVPTVTYNFIF
jgi:hypothetical protein